MTRKTHVQRFLERLGRPLTEAEYEEGIERATARVLGISVEEVRAACGDELRRGVDEWDDVGGEGGE